MSLPGKCKKCKKRQVASSKTTTGTTAHGLCPDCAKSEAIPMLDALLHHGLTEHELFDLVAQELAEESTAPRRDIAALRVVPTRGFAHGLLVAVSRVYSQSIIAEHQSILQEQGSVVFGKFRASRDNSIGCA